MTSQDVTGRVALVTGATSGIGRAVARRLARDGLVVVVSGRDQPRAEKVVADIEAEGGTAYVAAADLHDEASVGALARRAIEIGGGHVDVLVHSAGTGILGPTAETAESQLDYIFGINVKVPYLLTGQLAPAMAARGDGAIVSVSSIASGRGIDGLAAYAATKAAIDQLTRSWAAEYGPHGVRVNAVAPGTTETPMIAPARGFFESLAERAPARRPASPDEVASAVAYLVSPHAVHVHGAILPVDGGFTAVT
ncbi:SDR family NAD(P)-dependent oxidoreductase [Streptomyces sp. NPDC056987]|uniref:SDR family NAD(P)-dependent oxidoreductase n=1 Tax=Streptomyces sp. NPDC056987 TaxID=3345988 RepID=UPI00362C5A95